MEKRKSQRGSITLFVLIACMFFIIILLIINIGVINRNTNQEKKLEEISKAYEVNENDIDDTYKRVVDENQYATIGDVYEIVNQEISDLFPTDYIKPSVVNGVSYRNGGYVQIGNIVIVNMGVTINTSQLSLSTNNNNQTIIASGFPKPKGTIGISSYYTVTLSNGHSTQYNWTKINQNGELCLSTSVENKYTSGYGIRILGTYILKE